MRELAAASDPSQAVSFAPDLSGVEPEQMGAQDELKKLGRAILKR